jgi:hypothetical protein
MHIKEFYRIYDLGTKNKKDKYISHLIDNHYSFDFLNDLERKQKKLIKYFNNELLR